jgi:hypothetical protein
MGKLEKIVSSAKKHWKEIVTAIALPFIFKSNVGAGTLNTRVVSSITKPYCKTQHISGAREPEEGYDNGKDARFNDMQFPPTIDIYSKINFDPYRLNTDARPPESTTTFNLEISGRGLTAQENIELKLSFSDYLGNNFSWKNIIAELYQRIDDGEGSYTYTLIGNYDIKNIMVRSDPNIYISINNGITQGDEFFPSHKLNYSFYNHADLNRDRKVDGKDFAIWANNFGRNDPNSLGDNVGSDVNDFDAYADIDRNGIVDINDLSTFSGEWLWDANDPNTWSRVR